MRNLQHSYVTGDFKKQIRKARAGLGSGFFQSIMVGVAREGRHLSKGHLS